MTDPQSTPHEGSRSQEPESEEQQAPTILGSGSGGRTDDQPLDTGSAKRKADESDDTWQYLGRYRIVGDLGRGGFGSVYLAQDESLNRPVAIKVLQRHPQSAERDRESSILASLRHPGIAEIYDVGVASDGLPFLVTRYVDGRPLSQLLQEERPTPLQAARWVQQIAEALQAAHSHGVTHRDIKPANVMIATDGNPVLLDFGVALRDTELRGQVDYSGTPAWMSPEQASGRIGDIDGRSDLFSLGAVFYELLTGTRAFGGASHVETLALIQTSEPRPPRQLDPHIPPSLEAICLRCLRKNPTDRYATAGDLAAELRTTVRRLERAGSSRIWKQVVVCAAAMMLLVAGLSWWNFASTEGERGLSDGQTPTNADSAAGNEQAVAVALAEILDRMNRNDALRRSGIDVQEARESQEQKSQEPDTNTAEDDQSESDAPVRISEYPPVVLPLGYEELQQQLDQAVAAADRNEEASLLLNATNSLVDDGHFAIAEQAARRMVFVSQDDPALYPMACGQLGLALYKRGKFDESVDSLRVSADRYGEIYDRLLEETDSEQVLAFRSQMARMLGITYLRIGNAWKFAEKYDQAEEAFRKAMKLYEKHDRRKEMLTVLLNYGSMESQRGHNTSAIALLSQGLELIPDNSNPETRAEFFVNLGNAHSRMGDEKAAMQAYTEAESLARSTSDYELRSKLLLNLATSLLQLDQTEAARQRLLQLKEIARPGDTDAAEALELLKLLPAPEQA